MGNIVPEFIPGAAGAAFSGLWIHDAVGFCDTNGTGDSLLCHSGQYGSPGLQPFFVHVRILGLFFFYPLNGTHHYIYSVIPMATQTIAILASTLLGLVVVVVVSNLMLSQHGAGWLAKDPALRFTSTLCCSISSLACKAPRRPTWGSVRLFISPTTSSGILISQCWVSRPLPASQDCFTPGRK